MLLFIPLLALTFTSPIQVVAVPTALLDTATVTGKTSGNVEQFLGIPYAYPPVGDRRFRLPTPLPPYTSNIVAQNFGKGCPGQSSGKAFSAPGGNISARASGDPEDCLALNVIRPSTATSTSKLPVVVWIYGGAFAGGSTSGFDGTVIVKRSIELNQPIIYASMDYRNSVFGFLAGKEAKAAGVGNLGLQDQRVALRWVRKYIAAFGGDPDKVTIWGESSGAMSVAFQMITNGGNTESLFRGAFMQSGSPLPLNDMTYGQKYYDSVVKDAGCANKASTLDCLRQVNYQTLQAAINKTPGVGSYQAGILAWLPRVDGVFFKDSPQKLVQKGEVARIPFVSGSCDDEGTVFSFTTTNITTNAQFEGWIRQYWFPGISDSEMAQLLSLYPSDVTQGSPYDTGSSNALTPQFKRISSLQGDAIFQAPRRQFFKDTVENQPGWSYITKRQKNNQYVGASHGSDMGIIYGPGDLTDYLVHFVNTLDPNGNGITPWPRYRLGSRQLLRLTDAAVQRDLQYDDFRTGPMGFLMDLSLRRPFL